MTSMTLVRRIAAWPSVVFEALITPDGIRQWWGPDDGPVILAESDARVGGRFRVRFRMRDNTKHECSGEYLVVDPPDRVVMSWRWHGDADDTGVSRLEITLRAIAEGAELTLTHSRLRDETIGESHAQGWASALDRLVAIFKQE